MTAARYSPMFGNRNCSDDIRASQLVWPATEQDLIVTASLGDLGPNWLDRAQHGAWHILPSVREVPLSAYHYCPTGDLILLVACHTGAHAIPAALLHPPTDQLFVGASCSPAASPSCAGNTSRHSLRDRTRGHVSLSCAGETQAPATARLAGYRSFDYRA